MSAPVASSDIVRRLLSRTLVYLLTRGLLLFGAAGTFRWPAAWIYLGLTASMSVVGGLALARHDPGLLQERLGSVIQRDQKPWDKRFMVAMFLLWAGWLVLIGLDAGRYHWSDALVPAQILGGFFLVLASWIIWRAFAANRYASPVVRIQSERGHRVATTGPYAHVRHPMYSGGLLFRLGAPLLLGSWWGLLAAIAPIVVLGMRAVREERTLMAELEGYAEYAARVRYRLVPLLW